MKKEIKSVAFDLGGVLLFQDFSEITEEEQFLFTIYMNRNKQEKMKEYYQLFGYGRTQKILKYAEEQMPIIYTKIHKPNKEALKTLEALKNEKITPTIWTNNIEAISIVLERFNFYDYINPKHITNSFDVGCDKPNKRFYQYALKKLRQEPNKVLFIDDNPKNIEGSRNLKIHGMEYVENKSQSLTKVTLEELERIQKR